MLKAGMKKDSPSQNPTPVCFGDEVKFVTYMETQDKKEECSRCPRESECGEYILLKCSRELVY
jgi:hypothetical protein